MPYGNAAFTPIYSELFLFFFAFFFFFFWEEKSIWRWRIEGKAVYKSLNLLLQFADKLSTVTFKKNAHDNPVACRIQTYRQLTGLLVWGDLVMRIEQTSVLILASLLCLLSSWPPLLDAQLSGISARSLDALLQDYAFRAFAQHPRTGTPYAARLPSNLSGLQATAMRLRSGSLKNRGVHSYNEFQIPVGITEQPYVERLGLVYHNLANWSSIFYPLPGFTYLAPVLGLLAYDASDLSASSLPELYIRASYKPILISFPNLTSAPADGLSPKCVYFDLDGSVQFDNVLSGNVCSATQQGHFSIAVESTAPSPAPNAAAPPPNSGRKGNSRVWTVVGSLVGGFALLALLGILVVLLRRCKNGKKVQQMEWAADGGETLQRTSVGNTKAPLAMGTRTRPVLENEYVP
jgi:hypothetical protein